MTKFGRPHKHFLECSSTNDIAREWALDGEDPAPSGALVTADFQTRGRGQRGHEWQADAGQSALMSYVYRLPVGVNPGELGLLTAAAAADALASLGFSPQLKWPNDILLDGGKAGGILVEVTGGTAVLGIGLNISQKQFPEAADYRYPPTSLRLSGQECAVESVVGAVGHSLTGWEERRRREGFGAVLQRCRECLAVGVTVRQGEVFGALIGLADNGAAVVRLPDGTFREWTTVN